MSDPKALADRLQAYEEERCLGHFDCPIPHDLFRDVEALLRALAAAAPPPDLRVDANGNQCSADPCADHGSHYSIPAPPPDRNDLLGGQGGRGPEAPATQRQTSEPK